MEDARVHFAEDHTDEVIAMACYVDGARKGLSLCTAPGCRYGRHLGDCA